MQTIWNKDSLDQLRQVMDPDADAAIASVYQSKSNDALRTMLTQIASNDSSSLETYFSSQNAPELYSLINRELKQEFSADDISKFNRTHELWMENGIQFVYILFFRALPFTYAAEKPANVLRLTRLIEDQATRRIFETAQFVFDVMDSNWWEPDKRGIITSVKIRLMHAAMRYMLLNHEDGVVWDPAWGMPISQEDMIATNQVFSLEFFKGMEILGDGFSPEDQEAWFHTWKVIGRIMGIQENLLMPTVAEGWELQQQVYDHLFNDTHSSGIGLAKALVGALEKFMMPTKLALIIMKKMMYDEKYPDTFNKMLGPTYGDEYGSLFMKARSVGEANDLEENINNQFFDELKDFQQSVKDYREKELDGQFTTRGEADKNLVDHQLDEFSDIFAKVEHKSLWQKVKDDAYQAEETIVVDAYEVEADMDKSKERGLAEEMAKVKDEVLKRAMNAVGAVIMDVLSKHFRAGKNAGFRISTDLKDHWALK